MRTGRLFTSLPSRALRRTGRSDSRPMTPTVRGWPAGAGSGHSEYRRKLSTMADLSSSSGSDGGSEAVANRTGSIANSSTARTDRIGFTPRLIGLSAAPLETLCPFDYEGPPQGNRREQKLPITLHHSAVGNVFRGETQFPGTRRTPTDAGVDEQTSGGTENRISRPGFGHQVQLPRAAQIELGTQQGLVTRAGGAAVPVIVIVFRPRQ